VPRVSAMSFMQDLCHGTQFGDGYYFSTTLYEPNIDRGARFCLLTAHTTHILVSPFFPVRALFPLLLHPHSPRRNPLTDQCLGHGRKNLVTVTEGNISPRCYPSLAAIRHAGIPSPTTRARRTTPPNRSSHAPQMPRQYPPSPKRNLRLTAMEGITTQSPRLHPAHRTTIGPHPIASAGPPRHLILHILRASPARILRCSSTSHSTRQPRLDLVMLEYKMEDTSLSTQI
jgi:hypothetical protein